MKNKLNYFISKTSMFCVGFFLMYKYSGKEAYISLILGTLLGVVVIYIYDLIRKRLNNNNLKETLLKEKFGYFYLFILILFYLYLMLIILILLPMFVNSFYLVNTPKLVINLSFLLIAIYLSHKNKFVLFSLSNLLFYISIFIIIIFSLMLSKYLDISNLMPFLSNKISNILFSSLIYASITSIPTFITIDYQSSFKNTLKYYLISSLVLFGITFLTTLSLGEPLVKIFSFPEYAVLKQIRFLNFIENIENISSIIWYLDMFIMLSTLLINLKDTLPKKHNLIYYYSLNFIILILSSYCIGKNYITIAKFFYLHSLILFIFFLIFVSLLFVLKKKKITKSD